MIIPDTNVLSELVRPNPSPAVHAWIAAREVETLRLCAPVLAELLTGIAYLPEGRRRSGLKAAVTDVLGAFFPDAPLPFDAAAAEHFANLMGSTRMQGISLSIFDAQIAAIATVHHTAVATRDTAPFAAAGVRTIDPWAAAPQTR